MMMMQMMILQTAKQRPCVRGIIGREPSNRKHKRILLDYFYHSAMEHTRMHQSSKHEASKRRMATTSNIRGS